MRPATAACAAVLLAAAAGPARGDPGKAPAADRVPALVKQLGAPAFADREAAGRGLVAVGEKALPALRAEVVATADPEVRERGAKVIRAILLAARKSKSIGLETALIDPGEFVMGSPRNEAGRRPDEAQHAVRITRPFLLGAYEVTQDEYRKVTNAAPSWFAAAGGGKAKVEKHDTARFPVEQVTWFDAAEFCNKLSKLDGYDPYYRLDGVKAEGGSIKAAAVTIAGGTGYRLPTEAEWEYACRARTARAFHFGFIRTGGEANFKMILSTGYATPPKEVELGRAARVGSYKPNDWGLYDLHGNVGEWCQDWYDKDYYAASPADDPPGPAAGTQRAVRGGSWLVTYGSCRAASRLGVAPGQAGYTVGFRVARTP